MSLHWPIIIDVEASGFGAGSYPIEVGVALPDGQTQCFLVKPEPDWNHWDEDSETVHGIRRPLLMTVGKPVREAAALLNQWLVGETVYSDGWHMDRVWLSRLFHAAGMVEAFRLESLRCIMTEDGMRDWDETRAQVLRELSLRRHRASNDARVLQHTYVRTHGALVADAGRFQAS